MLRKLVKEMAKVKFEDKMKRLQEIVELLDDDNTDLDNSIKLYKEGLDLSKDLKKQLSSYESQIEEIGEEK